MFHWHAISAKGWNAPARSTASETGTPLRGKGPFMMRLLLRLMMCHFLFTSSLFSAQQRNSANIIGSLYNPLAQQYSELRSAALGNLAQEPGVLGASSTPDSGTIQVKTSLDSSTFTITGFPGPQILGSGRNAIFENVPAGDYAIAFGSLAGFLTPSPQAQRLSGGGTISFQGAYQLLSQLPRCTNGSFDRLLGTSCLIGDVVFSFNTGELRFEVLDTNNAAAPLSANDIMFAVDDADASRPGFSLTANFAARSLDPSGPSERAVIVAFSISPLATSPITQIDLSLDGVSLNQTTSAVNSNLELGCTIFLGRSPNGIATNDAAGSCVLPSNLVVSYDGDMELNVHGDASVRSWIFHAITPAQPCSNNQFQLRVDDSVTGKELSHFDFSATGATAPAQHLKLGQEATVGVFPLQADCAVLPPIPTTEQVSDANDQSPTDSEVFSKRTELFKGKVLVHFPLPGPALQHKFFPVHSGASNVHFYFANSGQEFTVTLPMQITNCVSGDCTPGLSNEHQEFDHLLMKFADRNGVPPQLLKSQVAEESGFLSTAFRYEPLSIDFRALASPPRGVPFGPLADPAVRPWALGQSSDCTTVMAAQGSLLDLTSDDATARHQYNLSHDAQSRPLCRVTSVDQVMNAQSIASSDTLPSMENVFFTNDSDPRNHWLAAAASALGTRPRRFFDYQVHHPPFTAQTVIASSYGLHQVLYQTAISERYVDQDGVGLSPKNLFRPSTSLDLGAQYLAIQFRAAGRHDLTTGAREADDYNDEQEFLSQFAPALRGFNAGSADFTVDQGKTACFTDAMTTVPTSHGPKSMLLRNIAQFYYACTALRENRFNPTPLSAGGN